MDYIEKLKDPRWQKLRLKVFERDNFRCQKCHDNQTTLHVHHRYYISKKEPWEYPLEALTTLCHECHTGDKVGMSRTGLLIERLSLAIQEAKTEFTITDEKYKKIIKINNRNNTP